MEIEYLSSKIPLLSTKAEGSFELLKDSNARVLSQKEALKDWQELRDYFREVWLYELGSLMKKVKLFGLRYAVFWFLRTLPKFLTYQKAASIYFGNNTDRYIRKKVVKKWEETVK